MANLIREWVTLHFDEFRSNHVLLDRLHEFIADMYKSPFAKVIGVAKDVKGIVAAAVCLLLLRIDLLLLSCFLLLRQRNLQIHLQNHCTRIIVLPGFLTLNLLKLLGNWRLWNSPVCYFS